jgi:arylsulfatase A-like enzyme
MPIEWVLSGSALHGLSFSAKLFTLSSGLILNYLPAAVGLAGAGLLGAAIPWPRSKGYLDRANRILDLLSWAVVMFVATLLAKRIINYAGSPHPRAVLVCLNAGMVTATLALSIKNLAPDVILALPRRLSLVMLPMAMLASGAEWFQSLGTAHPTAVSGSVNRPDILLITVDALSAPRLSLYGASRDTTPSLKALAQHSVVVEQCHSSSNWTRPGIASILSGTRPWVHGGDYGIPNQGGGFPPGLVQSLRGAGYQTECVLTNMLVTPLSQNLQGAFDRAVYLDPYNPALHALVRWLPSLAVALSTGPMARLQDLSLKLGRETSLEKTTAPLAAVRSLLARPEQRPRFLWCHLMTPHSPYAAPPPYLGRFEPSPLARRIGTSFPAYGFAIKGDPCFPDIYAGRYDEALACLDAGLGNLFDWLKSTGRFDRTVIAVIGDHGESFSHGYGQHGGPILSEEQLWVPCILKFPGQKVGRRVTGPCEQIDLAPTLLDIAGLPVPKGMEGRIIGSRAKDDLMLAMNRDFSSGAPTCSLAVLQGGWKYVTHQGAWKFKWPKEELYDLTVDPKENDNLAEVQVEKVRLFRSRSNAMMKEMGYALDLP